MVRDVEDELGLKNLEYQDSRGQGVLRWPWNNDVGFSVRDGIFAWQAVGIIGAPGSGVIDLLLNGVDKPHLRSRGGRLLE